MTDLNLIEIVALFICSVVVVHALIELRGPLKSKLRRPFRIRV